MSRNDSSHPSQLACTRAQLCPTFRTTDCSPPQSSVHGFPGKPAGAGRHLPSGPAWALGLLWMTTVTLQWSLLSCLLLGFSSHQDSQREATWEICLHPSLYLCSQPPVAPVPLESRALRNGLYKSTVSSTPLSLYICLCFLLFSDFHPPWPAFSLLPHTHFPSGFIVHSFLPFLAVSAYTRKLLWEFFSLGIKYYPFQQFTFRYRFFMFFTTLNLTDTIFLMYHILNSSVDSYRQQGSILVTIYLQHFQNKRFLACKICTQKQNKTKQKQQQQNICSLNE